MLNRFFDALRGMAPLVALPEEPSQIAARRMEFLQLIAKATLTREAVVFLWLVDKRASPPDLRLQHCCLHPATSKDSLPGPYRQFVSLDGRLDNDDLEHNPVQLGISRHCQPQLQAWLNERTTAAVERAFALRSPEKEVLGILHIVHTDQIFAAFEAYISEICIALTGLILRSREYRRLKALTYLQEEFTSSSDEIEQSGTTPILAAAARILARVTDARLCLVYRQGSSLGLECVASSDGTFPIVQHRAPKGSLTYNIYKNGDTVVVRSFADTDERLRVFGTTNYDRLLAEQVSQWAVLEDSLLCASVRVHRNSYALFKLLGKNGCLSKAFSTTDLNVVEDVCSSLAATVPSTALHQVVRRLAQIGGFSDTESSRLLHLLQDMVPGVVAVAVIREHDSSLHIIQQVGEKIFGRLRAPLRDEDQPMEHDTASDEYIETRQLDVRDDHVFLVIGLRRGFLTWLEGQIIRFVAKDIANHLQNEQHFDELKQRLIEIRHSIRSMVQGFIGHAAAAAECYDLFREMDDGAGLARSAGFRKSFNRARYFAHNVDVLLEESRISLQNISRVSLRLSGQDIRHVVREAIDALRPFAEMRNVDIDYVNRISAQDHVVTIDRLLVFILVWNLVDNGIKYSHRDRRVSIVSEMQGRYWVISVVDDGVAISDDERYRIFEPYVRGNRASGRLGTGLGLAVSKQIVDAHGGHIDFVSTDMAHFARVTFVAMIPRRNKPSEGGD